MLELFHHLDTNAAQPVAEKIVLSLLYQLIAILLVTRIVVWVSRRYLAQTDVSGEILAGLVLGPSCLGALFPEQMRTLFAPSTTSTFTAIAQLALVFLMFEVGLSFEFGRTFERNKKSMVLISAMGIVLPFGLGLFTASWFWERLPITTASFAGFRLFFAVAMSITAIPILGRIFLELNLSHTRIAALVLSAAAIDDVSGWVLLGVVGAIVQSQFAPEALVLRVFLFAAYLGAIFLVVRPLLLRALAKSRHGSETVSSAGIAALSIVLFASAIVTSKIGVFAIIGGFALGVALHDDKRFATEWSFRVSPFIRAVLLPVFFTYTGLRTEIGSLNSPAMWLMCLQVILIASIGKGVGAYLAARMVGEPHRQALTIGVCMNTRGLMELVALNVGYDLGVLPREMFTMLVIMAIVSTFITAPAVRWLMRDEMRSPSRSRSPASELAPVP